MYSLFRPLRFFVLCSIVFACGSLALAQRSSTPNDTEFGPVVSAYLGYLHNEQEVVDDRASRREISAMYYRRNSNRIHALRQMAVRLVKQSGNDYVPELEAVTSDEMGTIFERPPRISGLRQNEVFANKFRFLGQVHAGEMFYLFARLDPYEQADLMSREGGAAAASDSNAKGQRIGQSSTRARRVTPP
jgi:hypothetical protein